MIYTIFLSIFLILLFLIFIFALGRFFQVQYNIFNSNPFMVPLIGFVVFIFITSISYLMPIVFNMNSAGFISFEIIKDIFILIFIIVNKNKISFNGNLLKMIFLILLSVLLTNIPFLMTDKEAYSNIPTINKHFNQIFSNNNLQTNIMNNKTWFILHSIIIFISDISVKADVFWIQGIIITLLATSVVFAFIFSIKRHIDFISIIIGIGLVCFGWYIMTTYKGDYIINAGVAITLLILLIFGWELISRPQLVMFTLSTMIISCIFAFMPSILLIYSFYFISLFILYIIKNKPKASTLFIVHFIPLIFATIILYTEFSRKNSIFLILSLSTLIVAIIIFKRYDFNKNIDLLIQKYKVIIVSFICLGLLISSIVVSQIIGIQKAPFMHLTEANNITNHEKFHKTTIYTKYSIYFLLMIIGFVNTFFLFKNDKSLSLMNFSFIFGSIMSLLFFTPITSPIVSIALKPQNVEWISWLSIIPIGIGTIGNIKKLV